MENCLFCKIIRGEIPSTKLYEDSEIMAFLDIAPEAPVHFLVVPKKHIVNLMEMQAEDVSLLGRLLYKAQQLAHDNGCSENGARFVFNCKTDGGQTVDHLHLHVLGGRGMHWPPG